MPPFLWVLVKGDSSVTGVSLKGDIYLFDL